MDSQSRAQSPCAFSTRVMGCDSPGNGNAGSGVELPGHELRMCEVKVTCYNSASSFYFLEKQIHLSHPRFVRDLSVTSRFSLRNASTAAYIR